MADMERTYRIGGHGVRIRLEAPWTFRTLTPEQQQIVARLRAGGDAGVLSVPADRQEQLALNEALMGREPMTRSQWEQMSAAEQQAWRHALDFLPYAPFEVPVADPLMTFTLHADGADAVADTRGQWTLQNAVDSALPYYYAYTCGPQVIYEYLSAPQVCAGYFVLSDDGHEGHYYPCAGVPGKVTQLQVNTSLMIQYTFATAASETLLLHASVTRHAGKGNLFFGVSGTGKSTHSRLWHETVPGSDLMNDDNPILSFVDGIPCVYGSPWSGKTLCYRNVQAPVRALVRLEQAPGNRIVRQQELQAYASVIAAVSTIRWSSAFMSRIIPTIERVAMTVPCFLLSCRPDAAAVQVCRAAIEAADAGAVR